MEKTSGGVLAFLENNPTITIGGAIVVVLLFGALLLRKANATGTGTSTTSNLSGLGVDANGNPVVFVPTSTEFYTDNSVAATSAPGAPATIGNIGSPAPVSTTTTTNTTTTNPPGFPHQGGKPPVSPGHGGTGTGGTHPKKSPPPPPTHKPAKSIHWTKGHHVGSGETLSSIAAQDQNAVRSQGLKSFVVTWQQIYQHNKTTIDNKAKAMHGKAPYYNDLYPGELIVVPEYR